MLEKKKITKKMIREKILGFLQQSSACPDTKKGKFRCGMEHRNALVLATSHNDVPRATALEFFHEGLNLYILGVPGGKIANIKRNKNVSAFIYEQPMSHSVLQKSLQIFGAAELITCKSRKNLFKTKLKKYNMDSVMKRLLEPVAQEKGLKGKEAQEFIDKFIEACSFIKITPHHMILKEYRPDFSMGRFEWKKH
jgi:nitroimidazol reductase NimA-like FMN-containing flavoprotein (pyridoxamine 5'-phosphate oxidase superfamily)